MAQLLAAIFKVDALQLSLASKVTFSPPSILLLLIIIFWVKKVALLNDYKEEEFAKVSKVVEEAKQEEFRRLEVKEDSG